MAEYLWDAGNKAGDGASIKVPPKPTPDDASDTVDRSAKLAARAQHGVLGRRKAPEELERLRVRRRQQRERSQELLARIHNDLHQTDAVLDEREPTRVEARELKHDKDTVKKILRDTRVHKRIQGASERRRDSWAERHGGEPADTTLPPEGKGR